MDGKEEKGSITVEAVFLMPMICGIVMLTIWMALYLHDRIIVRAVLGQTIGRAGDYLVYGTLPETGILLSDDAVCRGLDYAVSASMALEEERVEAYVCQQLSGQLFLYQLGEISFQKQGGNLLLRGEFSCVGGFLSLFGLREEVFVIEMEEEMFFAAAEEITRAGNVLLELLEHLDQAK